MGPTWTQLTLLLAAVLTAASEPEPAPSDETLRVRSAFQRYDLADKAVTYEGGVVAEAQGLRLSADKLVVWDDVSQSRAEAVGNVRLEDGAAEVLAARLEWNWRLRTGFAEDVRVRIGKSLLSARRAEVRGERWTLYAVSVTPCGEVPSPLVLRAAQAEVEEGRRARLRRVEVRALGGRIASLPSYRLALVRSESVTRIPRVTITERGLVAAAWDQTFPYNKAAALDLGASVEERHRPQYSARLGWSFSGSLPLKPYGDLGSRFSYGFFDHLAVSTPEEEREVLSDRRRAVFLSSQWTVRPSGRSESPTVNKPMELIGEVGGSAGPIASFVQARVQRVEPLERAGVSRLVLQGAASAPVVALSPRLAWLSRIDAGGYLGGSGMFWGQLQTGLVYRPTSEIDLGAAVVLGGHVGTPDYAFDRLFSTTAVHVRFDWRGAATKVGLLGKYDFDRRWWYDYGIRFQQAAGCFEPYVIWRKFPNDLTFGVNLRLDELTDWVRRRNRGFGPVKPR